MSLSCLLLFAAATAVLLPAGAGAFLLLLVCYKYYSYNDEEPTWEFQNMIRHAQNAWA